MKDRTALKIISTIAAKLASGQISIEDAEAFANSGEIGEVIMIPLLGETKSMCCNRCARKEGLEETIHVFASRYHDSLSKEPGHTKFRWDCTRCKVESHLIWDTRSGRK